TARADHRLPQNTLDAARRPPACRVPMPAPTSRSGGTRGDPAGGRGSPRGTPLLAPPRLAELPPGPAGRLPPTSSRCAEPIRRLAGTVRGMGARERDRMDAMNMEVQAAAVRVEGLSRRYGAVRALDGVDLTLDRGITGLLGPNG